MGEQQVMSLFHRHDHKWQIAGVNFTEPTNTTVTGFQGPSDLLERLTRRALEGVTHVYLRCEGCGDLKALYFYGKFTPQGDDMELERLRKMVEL